MTKGKIIALLQALAAPDTAEVMLFSNSNEFEYNSAEQVVYERVLFKSDDVPKSQWAEELCVIIKD